MKRVMLATVFCLGLLLNGEAVQGQSLTDPTCAMPGTTLPVSCRQQGLTNAGYPVGSTPATGLFSGADTTSATATMTPPTGQSAYLCGYRVSGLGSTAGGPVSVTSTAVGSPGVGGTLTDTYVFPAGATTASTPVNQTFSPCLLRSLISGSLVLTVPGQAGNTQTNIVIWGYFQ